MVLIKPTLEHLPSYVAALSRGWSPSTHEDTSRAEIQSIERDPVRFIELQEDRNAEGDPIRLDDGSFVQRLPSFRRWIWDGDFAGVISLRWKPGTPELPPWCLGHIGYSIVEWKRRRGYATEALRLMLPEARKEGLPYLEVVTSPGNEGSRRVIVANGGLLIERFVTPASVGAVETLRFRINL